MKEIGGYFELELSQEKEYHFRALRLNSGRNALRYITKVKKPGKIYIPDYVCDSLLESITREKIDFDFYPINEYFEPLIDDSSLDASSFIIYVNYFGVNDRVIDNLSGKYENLIIDNAQAFFSRPVKGVPSFYSPRKFFGVSDGGYVYIDTYLERQMQADVSCGRYEHLLKRLDLNARTGYQAYRKNEHSFSRRPLKKMSKLTHAVLKSIDYARSKKIRENNFRFLHRTLKGINELELSLSTINGPMVYPLLVSKKGLKEILIRSEIYVATYWTEVLNRVKKKSFEYKLTKFLIPLPIDQRYGVDDMKRIINKISDFV
jgi:hypothetical protein